MTNETYLETPSSTYHNSPLILRSSVNKLIDEFLNKYSEKPESVLIKEIKSKLESIQ